jgi:hypothetical protein
MYRTATFLVLSLTLFSASADAADEKASPATTSPAAKVLVGPVPAPEGQITDRRPGVLPVLYVSFVALQGYDAYSTTAGIARGAKEANPAMRVVAGNQAALWAVKAGSTAASIWIAERMWKKNRVGAIVTMAAVNGMMAAVAARNASILNRMR